MIRGEAAEPQESDVCAVAVVTILETARAAIVRLGKATPIGAVRGLDVALASLTHPGMTMESVAGDLKLRANNLACGDAYRRQCAQALIFGAALVDMLVEPEQARANRLVRQPYQTRIR